MGMTEKQANVELLDASQGSYQCLECGQVWFTLFGRGGRRPRGWWKCPNGCNEPLPFDRARQ